jgi:hypothetical protein
MKVKSLLTGVIVVALFLLLQTATAQTMYIGLNTGMVNNEINSLHQNNSFRSEGWGYNLGFYLRYGKRPFYQAGIDWTKSNNKTSFSKGTETTNGQVPFHNFDLSFKLGYEIVQRPIFKWKASFGPFIGKSTLKSTDVFTFDQENFHSPQYGLVAGTGIKVTNMVFDLEYAYHFSNFFSKGYAGMYPDSHVETFSVKFGFMF